MKKYTWIVALLVALAFAFAFVACDDGSGKKKTDEDEDLVWKEVFKMSTDASIQALPVGKVTIGKANRPAGTDSPLKPLEEAGEGDNHVIIEAIAGTVGAIALKFEAAANWGAGIDMPNKSFGFRDGDKITVKGEILELKGATSSGDPRVELNFKLGSEDAHGTEIKAVGAIDWNIELTDAIVKQIQGGDPAAIRIGAYGIGSVVRIDEIIIEGNRPTNIKKLAAPVVTVSGNVVSWAAIEGSSGYKVFADAGAEPIATTVETSLNLLSVASLADGTYSITVVALGTTGSTSDSDPSAAVSATKATPVLTLKLTIDKQADFDYWQGGSGFIKGNIKADLSTQILSYAGTGEVRIFWTYTQSGDRGNSYGIGTFGEVGYNTPATGSTASGTAIILISDAIKLGGDGNDCIILNPYNDCNVSKVEVWAP